MSITVPPNLRLHLTRLSCLVVKWLGLPPRSVVEVCRPSHRAGEARAVRLAILRPRSRGGARGYFAGSSCEPNWVGLAKMLAAIKPAP